MLAAPSCEVVIAGRPEAGDTRELIEVVVRHAEVRGFRPGVGNFEGQVVHQLALDR
jgi:hypothetical protein